MRYFRSNVSVYESFRAALDAAWGYPNTETSTDTALPPAETLPADVDGRVYVAVPDEYCNYELPSVLLPQAIAAGAIEEITEDIFRTLYS